MRVKATISYDGSCFFGFQRQKENHKDRHITVESRFEEALRSIGIESLIIGSGRTDRGVHAFGQVISFSLPPFWRDLYKLKKTLNLKLNKKIVVRDLVGVKQSFHPRYSAKSRTYRYVITKDLNPFMRNYVTFKERLDLKKCNEALSIFVGKHDFEYYRKKGSDENSTVREIKKAFAYTYKSFTIFSIEGDGFLRSQVRLLVAAVFAYSDNQITLLDLKDQLEKRKHAITKPAPHEGLYLSKIKY